MLMNKFFTGIKPCSPNALDSTGQSLEEYEFYPHVVDEFDILRVLYYMPNKNSVGDDNISIRLIKLSLPSILPVLKHIFNLSQTTAKFLSC